MNFSTYWREDHKHLKWDLRGYPYKVSASTYCYLRLFKIM
jgi:hypothetical protein